MNKYAKVTLGTTEYWLEIKEGSLDCNGELAEVSKLYCYNETTDHEQFVYDEDAESLMDEMDTNAYCELVDEFQHEEWENVQRMKAEARYDELRGH